MDPAKALAHVEEFLPGLDGSALRALALVELAGRTRPDLVAETGVEAEELAAALARARKALRRAVAPLPGSGWCERAERLLSDELDGALQDPGPRRLAAHLSNCDRCSEHERRLWQARDRLVETFDAAQTATLEPVPPADEPDEEAPELPEPGPGPELTLVETPAPPAPAEPLPAPTPMPMPTPEDPAPAAAAVPGEPRSLTGLAWSALMVIAVLLAVASLALTAYAIGGGGF